MAASDEDMVIVPEVAAVAPAPAAAAAEPAVAEAEVGIGRGASILSFHYPALAMLPTKQMLRDLECLRAILRNCVILGGGCGPPLLRVTTVSRGSSWAPEWQERMFPGLKMIDMPVFFQDYRQAVMLPSGSANRCTLRKMVQATDAACTHHREVMTGEFEAQIAEWGTQNTALNMPPECARDMPLDSHARDVQRRMFAHAMEVQRDDYSRFFQNASTDFHLKLAGHLSDLSHMARVLLDADIPMREVEDRWVQSVAERNRKGALAHSGLC